MGERSGKALEKLLEKFPTGEARSILKILEQDKPGEFEFCNALERVLAGEPVQYVCGRTLFFGCWILVNPQVLIPRPETEELVELLLKEYAAAEHLRVMDIGTGSGCIPIALAKKRPGWYLVGTDISSGALKTAVENAKQNNVNVEFWLHDVLGEDPGMLPAGMDVLVSNPPYVTLSEAGEMSTTVKEHEPSLALFVPDGDPLLFYRRIIFKARKWLRTGGVLWFECNSRYSGKVAELLKFSAFTDIHILPDISGKERFVRAVLR